MRLTFLLALLPTFALAQSPTPRPEDLGSVTGHITCADTQRPARFAVVSLIPTLITTDTQETLSSFNRDSVGPVHTDLNGGYTISSVPPGQYYLRVDLAGYATPLSQFTPAELKAPTPEIQQRIQRELQRITVRPNSTFQVDVALRRSSSILGKITYDDGSPVINIGIEFARRDANGKLREFTHAGFLTDSHGEYGIDSLSPGEYAIRVSPSLPSNMTHREQAAENRLECSSLQPRRISSRRRRFVAHPHRRRKAESTSDNLTREDSKVSAHDTLCLAIICIHFTTNVQSIHQPLLVLHVCDSNLAVVDNSNHSFTGTSHVNTLHTNPGTT